MSSKSIKYRYKRSSFSPLCIGKLVFTLVNANYYFPTTINFFSIM